MYRYMYWSPLIGRYMQYKSLAFGQSSNINLGMDAEQGVGRALRKRGEEEGSRKSTLHSTRHPRAVDSCMIYGIVYLDQN